VIHARGGLGLPMPGRRWRTEPMVENDGVECGASSAGSLERRGENDGSRTLAHSDCRRSLAPAFRRRLAAAYGKFAAQRRRSTGESHQSARPARYPLPGVPHLYELEAYPLEP